MDIYLLEGIFGCRKCVYVEYHGLINRSFQDVYGDAVPLIFFQPVPRAVEGQVHAFAVVYGVCTN